MKVLGVHHVALTVADVDAAVAFYTGALGLTVRQDRPDFGIPGAWLDAGGQQLHLFAGSQPEAAGQHFAIAVEDLDSYLVDVRSAGVEVGEPVSGRAGRQTFVSDPSGNVIELREAEPAS
jgi:catechol 2,3-dioxygenase-like lactoylglutathione lyase family enzyme